MSEPGMMDMMRQAREMQKKMKQAQKRMAKTEITAEAGGGMVSVVINGKLEVRSVTVSASIACTEDSRCSRMLPGFRCRSRYAPVELVTRSESGFVSGTRAIGSSCS